MRARSARQRMRDAAGVETELARLARLRERATELKIGYWVEQIDIQIDAVRGFAAFKAGAADAGLTGLRSAAAREDASEKHVVTPGPLLPARELYAGALLETGTVPVPCASSRPCWPRSPTACARWPAPRWRPSASATRRRRATTTCRSRDRPPRPIPASPGLQLARLSVTR